MTTFICYFIVIDERSDIHQIWPWPWHWNCHYFFKYYKFYDVIFERKARMGLLQYCTLNYNETEEMRVNTRVVLFTCPDSVRLGVTVYDLHIAFVSCNLKMQQRNSFLSQLNYSWYLFIFSDLIWFHLLHFSYLSFLRLYYLTYFRRLVKNQRRVNRLIICKLPSVWNFC